MSTFTNYYSCTDLYYITDQSTCGTIHYHCKCQISLIHSHKYVLLLADQKVTEHANIFCPSVKWQCSTTSSNTNTDLDG